MFDIVHFKYDNHDDNVEVKNITLSKTPQGLMGRFPKRKLIQQITAEGEGKINSSLLIPIYF